MGGWAVIVANPHVKEVCAVSIPGCACPHMHVQTLWRTYIEPSSCSCVLVVAHSYGAPVMIHLLKCEPSARDRVKGLALTDGGAFFGSVCQEAIPTAEDVASASKPDALEKLRAKMEELAALAPDAFQA